MVGPQDRALAFALHSLRCVGLAAQDGVHDLQGGGGGSSGALLRNLPAVYGGGASALAAAKLFSSPSFANISPFTEAGLDKNTDSL